MNRVVVHITLVLTVILALAACSSGEKVIKIGAAVSETGRYSEEGKLTREGYLLWEDWVNNEYGGIDVGGERYKVELI
ncbi:MAG: branched-chain amino acid ABC transporter substrate-binding protein, partial [Dehalococcoidia bacterium]|nr:branched-chain amino acid ABC transporter substrate-binding protein [Dehalococcoidia bacterium]